MSNGNLNGCKERHIGRWDPSERDQPEMDRHTERWRQEKWKQRETWRERDMGRDGDRGKDGDKKL